MAEKVEEKKHQTPDWLKTIQLNSWEAELLVSALVLYALFQVPDFIRDFHLRSFDRGSQFHLFFQMIVRAVELLKYGYILHILVRGLWVASVGLSYVFPNGIDTDRLKFKGRFDRELNAKKSLVNNVLRLEELSSLFYGISFLAFGVLLGVGTLFFTFVMLSESMTTAMLTGSEYVGIYFLVFFIYLILIILVFIDFLTNGLFRRIDWMAAWFYPVAILFRVLTLSFLYRRSLLVLVSNFKSWKSYLVPLIVMLVCGGFVFIRGKINDRKSEKFLDQAQKVNILNDNYENLRDDGDQLVATIQSDVINDGALRLYMDDLGTFSALYRSTRSDSNIKWKNLDTDSTSHFLNQWLKISIDSVDIEDVRWFKTQHNSQLDFGFLAYLDIKEINRGHHNLSIKLDTARMNTSSKRTVHTSIFYQLNLSNIYFFYDKP